MENKFLAHIAEDGREQTVLEHMAAEFSRPFGGEAKGLLAGTAHDIGKYSAAFQRRLTGDSRRVDHATAGAFECMGRGQPFAAFAVAGHHGGLPDGGGRGDGPEAATFWGRINRAGRGGLEPYGAWAREVSLPGGQPPPFAKQNPGAGMFFTRMLYSCLVDADYLDTEAFMKENQAVRGEYDSLKVLAERFDNHPWLLLLLGVDCFCAVILWISDIQVFQTLIGLVVLTSILLFSAILFVLNKRENTHMELFRDFLSDPTICNEERLLSAISQKEGESVRFLASVLREYKNESNNMADALRDYEEYVEGWAHEAKTPLSLLTMLLDNRNDEISPSLQAKLDYVRSQLQEDVTQMLYYARLKSSTKDYRFEDVNLNDCLGEVLEDYAPLLEEKQFVILNKLQSETVYTDRRGLQFMLGQIVSNAIKYSSDSPMLTISVIHSETADILSVEDNGIGVKKYNLPYIFQKGFTGDSTDSRKKATGMGLYLVKKMADDLNLHLEAASQWGKGFKIVIFFPKLRSNGGK